MKLSTFYVLIILSSGIVHSQVPAENCNTVNLVTQPNSPFQQIPVYDQDGTNMCYAYSTAQLTDYYLIRNGTTGQRVHPAWAALANAKHTEKRRLNIGYPGTALEGLRELQNCNYNTVANALRVWSQQAHVTEAEIMNFLDNFGANMNSAESIEQGLRWSIRDQGKSECSANATYAQLAPMIRDLNITNYYRFVENILMPACQDSRRPINIPPTIIDEGTGPELAGKIAQRLVDSPVTIGYCMELMADPTFVQNSPPEESNCGGHESIVAGKKMIGGSCHFLIRNTWGSNWSSGNDKYTCVCRHKESKEYVEDCRVDTHSNALYTVEGCWVNSTILAPNLLSLASLQSGSVNPIPAPTATPAPSP